MVEAISPISNKIHSHDSFNVISTNKTVEKVQSLSKQVFSKIKEFFSFHVLLGPFDLNPINLVASNSNNVLRENIHKTEKIQKPKTNGDNTLVKHTDEACKIFCKNASNYITAKMIFALVSRKSIPESIFIKIAQESSTPIGAKKINPSFLNIFRKCLSDRLNFIQKFLAVIYYIFIGTWLPNLIVSQFTYNFINLVRKQLSPERGIDIQNITCNFLHEVNHFFDIYLGAIENYRQSKGDVTVVRDEFVKKEITKPNALKDKYGKSCPPRHLHKYFSHFLVSHLLPKISVSRFFYSKIFLPAWKPSWLIGKVVKLSISTCISIPLGFISSVCFVFELPGNFIFSFISKYFLSRTIPSILDKGIESIGSGTPFSHALNTTICYQLHELKQNMGKFNSDSTTIDNKILEKTHNDLRHFIKNLLEILYKEPLRSRQELENHYIKGPFSKSFFESVIRKIPGFDFDEFMHKTMEESILSFCIKGINTLLQPDKAEQFLTSFFTLVSSYFSANEHLLEEKNLQEEYKQKEMELRDLSEKIIDLSVDESLSSESSPFERRNVQIFYDNFKQASSDLLSRLQKESLEISKTIFVSPDTSKNQLSMQKQLVEQALDHARQYFTSIDIQIRTAHSVYSPSARREIEQELKPIIKRLHLTQQYLEALKQLYETTSKTLQIQKELNTVNKIILGIKRYGDKNIKYVKEQYIFLQKELEYIQKLDKNNHFNDKLNTALVPIKKLLESIEECNSSPRILQQLDGFFSSQLCQLGQYKIELLNFPTLSKEENINSKKKEIDAIIEQIPNVTTRKKIISLINQLLSAKTKDDVNKQIIIIRNEINKIILSYPQQSREHKKSIPNLCDQMSYRIRQIKYQLEVTLKGIHNDLHEHGNNLYSCIDQTESIIKNLHKRLSIHIDSWYLLPLWLIIPYAANYIPLTKIPYIPTSVINVASSLFSNTKLKLGITASTFSIVYGYHLAKNISAMIVKPIVKSYAHGFYSLMNNPNIYRGLAHAIMLSFKNLSSSTKK